jgi:hypothetical protein
MMPVSKENLEALLDGQDAEAYQLTFQDGSCLHLTDCCVSTDMDGTSSCIGTVLSSAGRVGKTLCFSLDQISEVKPSERRFEDYR